MEQRAGVGIFWWRGASGYRFQLGVLVFGSRSAAEDLSFGPCNLESQAEILWLRLALSRLDTTSEFPKLFIKRGPIVSLREGLDSFGLPVNGWV